MASIVKDLMTPSVYPENPKKITLAQTHISSVFIGERYVYKIKKPLNYGFLDFSTLEKRKYYCEKEVKLNSRFSKDVYLGVCPVTFNGKKHIINGKGEIVEYAVKMRRLPDEHLMKFRFKKGKINSEDIEKISKAIADFHKISPRSKKIDKYGNIDVVRYNTDENFQQTAKFLDISISKQQYEDLKSWTDDFYIENKELFLRRIKDGKIRDCHGDLHMEHICLTDPIIIFDCIEFNDRFRYSDNLSDIEFLLMDLEFNDGYLLSKSLCKSYIKHANEKDDHLTYDLIKFYKIYRAYVRGKVTSFILNDLTISNEKKIEAKNIAKKYFTLAYKYIT